MPRLVLPEAVHPAPESPAEAESREERMKTNEGRVAVQEEKAAAKKLAGALEAEAKRKQARKAKDEAEKAALEKYRRITESVDTKVRRPQSPMERRRERQIEKAAKQAKEEEQASKVQESRAQENGPPATPETKRAPKKDDEGPLVTNWPSPSRLRGSPARRTRDSTRESPVRQDRESSVQRNRDGHTSVQRGPRNPSPMPTRPPPTPRRPGTPGLVPSASKRAVSPSPTRKATTEPISPDSLATTDAPRAVTPKAARERMERFLKSPVRQRAAGKALDKDRIRREAAEAHTADATDFFEKDSYHWRSPVKTVTGSLSDGDEEAWECFEALVAKKKTITVEDIPFPKGLHSDEVYENKVIKKLMMRWHPDKFQQKFGKIVEESERFLIKGRVKEVFQTLQAITTD